MIKELELLGLSKNEAAIYEALVQSGQVKAGVLIARLDIHRNIVYEALESLIHKGFAAKIEKRGVWWFQITEPDSILTMVKRREQIAEGVIKEIKAQKEKTQQQIRVYEGIDSFRAYWLTSLERVPEGTVDYTAGLPSHGRWGKLMGEAAAKKYTDLRLQKKFFWKTILFTLTEEDKKLIGQYPELTETRLWQQKFNPLGNFNVIHDTVILQIMTDMPRIIEIRDPDMVAVFKNYFDAMWSVADPLIL